MRKLAILFLSLAPFAFANDAPRKPFPDDYTAAPCSEAMSNCETFDQWQLAQVAAKQRGVTVRQDWVDQHWNELVESLKPICKKAGACYAQPPNDWMFCNDLLHDDAYAICDRYPAGSDDHEQCFNFAVAYWFGNDRTTARRVREELKCDPPAQDAAERTMEVWLDPGKIGPDYKDSFVVYAIDAQTHIPVQALISMEGQTLRYASDVPNGKPTTYYPVKWPLTFNRVPNAQGHSDVVAPNVVVTAAGYKTVTFRMPVDQPKMIATMKTKLKRGKNTFVVETTDAVTGQPVEARVMAGDLVVGDTNKPVELEWKKGEKRPEIWVTSLFDRYSDVVVMKGE
jgi:hypothetical protein